MIYDSNSTSSLAGPRVRDYQGAGYLPPVQPAVRRDAPADISQRRLLSEMLPRLRADSAEAARAYVGAAAAGFAETDAETDGRRAVVGYGIRRAEFRLVPRHPRRQSAAQHATAGSVASTPGTVVSWAAVDQSFPVVNPKQKRSTPYDEHRHRGERNPCVRPP